MPDVICPTFAAGTLSLNTRVNNDAALAGQAHGSSNKNPFFNTVGSHNTAWNNECLTQSVTPTFSTSLVDFGNTGRQS